MNLKKRSVLKRCRMEEVEVGNEETVKEREVKGNKWRLKRYR